MSNDVTVSREFLQRVDIALRDLSEGHKKGVQRELEDILGGWKHFSESGTLSPEAIIEIKSGPSTLLAFQVRVRGKVTRWAYASMQESGIDWVSPDDVDGWREYKLEE
jgi:hypothetical protein